MIYFDNAATSFPKPESVYRAMDDFARRSLGNPGRSGHRLSRDSEFAIDRCRVLLNRFFHGEGPRRFIFTLNGTDALNLAIKGAVSPGDHVVTGSLEHNSVLRPIQSLEKAGVIQVTRLRCDAAGFYRPDDVAEAIRATTRLVVLTDASNVLGTIQPTAAIGQICRQKGVLFLVDAAQSAGARAIDVQRECIDLLATSGHKSLLGPTGTGVLYVGPRAQLRPWREGGTGGDSLLPTQPTELPFLLEAGTPNVLGIVGLSAGLEFLLEKGMEQVAAIHDLWVRLLHDALSTIPNASIYPCTRRDTDSAGLQTAINVPKSCGTGANHSSPEKGVPPASGPRIPVVTFNLQGIAPEDLATVLDHDFQIAVRSGLHCAPLAHAHLGTVPDGAVRLSLGVFNSEAEIRALAEALRSIARELS